MKLILIKWCDAIQNVTDAWSSREIVEQWAKTSDWEVESVGFLLADTKEYIVLSSKREIDQDGEEQFGMLIKIPKTWIRERHELTRKE
jgi:hypothetical protein